MSRFRTARVLAGIGAFGFLLAAVLHTSQYAKVVAQARNASADLAPLVAALWLAFAGAMLLLGTMAALVAMGRIREGRWILALAALFPAITVLLQLRYLGFIPPVVILSTVALVTIAAAAAWPSVSQQVGVAAD